jgi:hypothetical protein
VEEYDDMIRRRKISLTPLKKQAVKENLTSGPLSLN